MTDDEDQIEHDHELAHELCEVLESVITAFVQANGNDLPVLVVLSGVEMTASVWRKVALSINTDPEKIRQVMADAAECSKAHFEDRLAGVADLKAEVEVEDSILN